MGVISRRVLPACGNLCCFCPSLRARSRQPVKRYKKILADIFPRNQDAEPNERQIGKLCDYSSKNPLRIPKITETLEQRFYKELRHENFGSVKVVVCIYRKLLAGCKEQIPLFASSLLGIVRTLLEETRRDEMQILACSLLVDFMDNQTDSTYIFNLEGLIPKLCQLAQEVGDGERILCLRSAGLQALASMVSFMGDHSHISMEFDNIISVTLENYIVCQTNPEDSMGDQWVQGVLNADDKDSSFPDISKKVSLPSNSTKPHLDPSVDTSRSPAYWSRICLHNVAQLAKEATTVRRVLEPLFLNFDSNNHWPLDKGVAYPVLLYLQSLLEEAGANSHLLLANLVKHLDHRNIAKQPLVQIDIVNVTMKLGQNAKQEATVAITGAISDLIKHLRKCMQISAEMSSAGNCVDKQYKDLQFGIERCILQLSNKMGDMGLILDQMAMFLENISTTTIISRTIMSAVCQTARIIASTPNVTYQKKAFPDALFHQLLIVMVHPDPVTRVGAHNILSVVLMPSLLFLWSDQNSKTTEAFSDFFDSWRKSRGKSFSLEDEGKDNTESMDAMSQENSHILDVTAKRVRDCDSYGHSSSFKGILTDGKRQTCIRLSGHQVSLLLSSIWVQATSTDNKPANFDAMSHTYNIALLFTQSKASNHMGLVRCFQLALSLRSISLEQDRGLQPSHRRSLFTLASCMLIFSAKAGNFPELIPLVKASVAEKTVDPYLKIAGDIGFAGFDREKTVYGLEEDDIAASKSLSEVELDDHHLKETVTSQFMKRFAKLTEDELLGMKTQLLQEFSPDDAYPLGPPLFMDTPRPSSPLAQIDFQAFEEIMPAASLTDDETVIEAIGSQSDRKTSLSVNTFDILGVNELLESVLETARQVASSQVPPTPVTYDQMMSQCEALVTGKQQKMSMLHSFKNQHDAKVFPTEGEKRGIATFNEIVEYSPSDLKLNNNNQTKASNQLALCIVDHGQNSFRLPPSSPYDKFLKAARR